MIANFFFTFFINTREKLSDNETRLIHKEISSAHFRRFSPFLSSISNSHFRTIESPESRRDAKWQSPLSSCPGLTPLLAIRRQRDGRMENKVADGAIGMRPSAILRPSIFKSSSLAKRAGGRRVFLSRRKITHCPLSVVPRPFPTSCLPPRRRRFSCSLLLFASPGPLAEILSLSPFSISPVRPRQLWLVSSFVLRAISGE